MLPGVREPKRVVAEAHGRLLEDEAHPGAVELEPEKRPGEPGVESDDPLDRLGQPDLELLSEVEHLQLGIR